MNLLNRPNAGHSAKNGLLTSLFTARFSARLTLAALSLFAMGSVSAQVSGAKNIPGDYADLAAAIADVNAVGVGAGGATLNVLAGNAQIAPATGYVIATTSTSAANPLAIVGNANTLTASAALTAGATNDAIVKIVGADHVTISGFSILENAANTVTATASNNMVEFGVALFYATPTDNAQNITLQGNTITLNRASSNTFGIYANATHNALVLGSTASGTGATGGNSGLKIYGNTISNVNSGIVVVGPTAAADANDGVDIGGAGLATGNTLSNFGTTLSLASFANVASSVSGVLVRNSKNFNVSFNTITSSTSATFPTATNSGTLRGVYVPAFSAAPLGTIANSINSNTVALRGGATAVALRGVDVEAVTGNITTTVDINNNDFTGASFNPAASSGVTTLISNLGVVLNANINGNKFTNLVVNSTGAVTFITNGFSLPLGGTKNVNNNSIVTAFSKTGVGGTISLYVDNASSVAGSTVNNNNNNFSNITVTGTTGQAGWSNTDGGAPTKTVTGNTFSNWTNGGSASSITGLTVNFSGTGVVANNVISNFTGGGTITGLVTASGTTTTVSQNTVHTFSSSGASNVTGISCTSGTTVNLAQNKVYNLTGSNSSSGAFGITISGGTTVNAFNNIIGDLFLPSSGANVSLVGLNITGGTTVNASFNTVRLAASSTGASFGSVAVLASSTPTVTLRSNNFVNLSTANGTGLTIAYRRSSPTLGSYGSASNSNNFYAGVPSATKVIFTDTTNIDQTLAAFKARVSVAPARDGASVTENPAFASITGSAATFLHIDPATPSQLESTGVTVSGITDDFDGDVRNVSTPDIGADEFAGTFLDLVPPSIAYTPLANTTLTANRTITATVTDVSGVATGSNGPRIYFRKGPGAYVSASCAGAPLTMSCVVDYSLVGGVVVGDVISYFVVAQDAFTPTNVGSNPSAGFAATDVNSVSTPPSVPNAYTIVVPIAATLNVGAGEAISSITNANGLFAALNAGVLSANTIVTLTADMTAETGAVVLNPLSEELGAFNLTIQPGGARQIIGASSSTTPLMDINGADRITINGLNAGGNTLLIRNTAQGVIRYINDASSNALRNTTLEGTAGFTVVNVASGITTGNDNIQIVGNTIRDRSDITSVPFILVGSFATTPAISNSNLLIDSNILINFTSIGVLVNSGTDNITVTRNNISQTATRGTTITGISVGACFGSNVFSRNTIRNFTASGAAIMTGMAFADVKDTTVSRNSIFNFNNVALATGAINGIGFFGGTSTGPSASILVANNMITLSPSVSTNQIVRGIFDFGFANNTFIADYNSIYIGGVNSGSASSWALVRRDVADTFFTARNNIAFNNRTGATSNHFAAGDASANTGTFVSNYNFFAGTGVTAANFMDYGTASSGTPVSFAAYQAGPPTRDTNSIAGIAASFVPADIFVDFANGDLHLKATAPSVLNAGTPVGTTVDLDGDPRSATAPEIGADELPVVNTAPTITPAAGLTRQQGSALSNGAVATVGDAEQTPASLVVTAPTVPVGLTVSSIANASGNVTADIAASCSATLGANSVGLSVSDGALSTAGNLSVNVTANTAPVLGSYSAAVAATGAGVIATPSAAPTDNGSVALLTVAAPGFAGTLSADAATGAITIGSAGPAGSYTVTVTATDNCNLTSTAVFTLTVSNANTAPTITPAAGLTRQQGSASSNGAIATVGDAEQTPASLVVTAPTVPAGLTVSGIANASGNVTADVAASCSATLGANSVGLSVSDGALSTAGILSVNVTANTAPVLAAYPATSIGTAATGIVSPASAPTENGSIVTLTAAASGFAGTLIGNPTTGAISVSNAGPASNTAYVVTVTATDNCGLISTTLFNLTVKNRANLDVTKDDGVSTYRAGDLLVYTLVLRNLGPDSANGVTFSDVVPASLINAAWTCLAANGAVCPQASGTGSINAVVATLPSTGRLTYTLQANVATPAPAQLSNTAQVSITGLPIVDSNLTNNSATDTNASENIFQNGFEDPIRLVSSGVKALDLSALHAAAPDQATLLLSAQDANGEALRVYGRATELGWELALALRTQGGLRLGRWSLVNGAASLRYVLAAGVLQSAVVD